MHFPSYEAFVKLAGRASLVTVCRRVPNDVLTPVSAFYSLDKGENHDAFLLESVESSGEFARYSYLAVNPFLHFRAQRDRAWISPNGVVPANSEWDADGHYIGDGDPLDALQSLLDHFRAEKQPGLPSFCGGAVGYIGYDAVRYNERLPNAPPDDRNLADLAFDFYNSVIVFDRIENTIAVTAHAHIPGPSDTSPANNNGLDLREIYTHVCGEIDGLIRRLQRLHDQVKIPLQDVETKRTVHRGFDKSNFEPREFHDAVRRCKDYIVAGDIFQVVISQRFETRTSAEPFDIYRALRLINPSPFLFYLRIGRTCLVGSSPEIMVRVEDGEVTIRPLAGTRPRGSTEAEDAELAEDLLSDEKERAEHVMLVDLARNDVGRIAQLGSVNLDAVMEIERYSHVMHISSSVSGRLADGKRPLDAIRSGLPAGTVSGAPKVRAMEIIDEIEPHRRGPYAGAVGYIDFTGNVETCLALRTLVCRGNKVYIQTGAGIVHDSEPEKEHQETLNKAKALLKAIETAEEWKFPMSNENPDILSGIQPTGELHFGNYFGAVSNWVALQDKYTCAYVIVDLHTMTMPYDPEELRRNTEQMVVDLLACGIDPEKAILFIQSLVPEHTELLWILSCNCAYGELGRMTQFKDKETETEFVSAGLYTYPVLQAADILAYRAKYVPVGQDQEQHLELSRSIARRFNQAFGVDFFPEPQPLFTSTPKIMSLADPQRKMSKSAGDRHHVGLFEDEKTIRKKVKTAVTDSGELPAGSYMSPGVANLFEILRACGKESVAEEMDKQYRDKSLRYADLKEQTADALVEVSSRLSARRAELLNDSDYVDKVMKEMCEKAREIARRTVREVRQVIGLPQTDAYRTACEAD